ncbi:molybdenum cofactor guanylyltransferase [Tuwongella immobilis]|uniref:Probable molybdenum cofactor guanylyltransferase n=1 Tax=Tuwongella immobilis TaxID=692036 RepID=A0A6C2YSS3_9BACT|nr:molybdenum cofactor guanylyltransferase [Tuwongella immobilis]VIP03932.1 molybdopterin-guanine dinucleotide biosynthesis protein a : Molybdenum cofactor guanylyltransferase OS=Candidatus Entotheonella sp. TSY2 GN=mobA PE=3 SV=1: NTP_transf_3 [Tuwongella immobilis]VTS05231.1 molybdopterin-guanine dinucleotide biosynthesis protein a : Molybdenum cofactor guanylyltransferase OS=Candidatus Entotheonella sp. TSY2 GN=mobA PE=3 SV=1: NTP_transf_3 [Tuwongella immobilis]
MRRIAGVVLAGGESRRMGRPKAMLEIAGEPMLARVIRQLSSGCSPIVVVSAAGQPWHSVISGRLSGHLGVFWEVDRWPGEGPLGGILTAMIALQPMVDAVLVCGCDQPFLSPAVISKLIDGWQGAMVRMPVVDGQRYPLTALYAMSFLPEMLRQFEAGERRPRRLADCGSTEWVSAAEIQQVDPDLLCLRNINTPDDYENAIRVCSQVDNPNGA